MAYGIQNSNPFDAPRVIGLPNWAMANRYDIEAKIAAPDVAKLHDLSPEDRMLLLKPLLHDRFKLAAHFENRKVRGYDMVVRRQGSNLQAASAVAGASERTVPAAGIRVTHGGLSGHAVSMTALARVLQTQVARPVVDRTGLTGTYDLTLTYAPRLEDRDPDSAAGPSIFTAVEEQLGLKLVPAKETVSFLVITHIEQPSEN
jgi:uncharacterized protein (TIGR03435 family)